MITDPIIQKYPKVKPLAQALIAAAAEQGANAEELEMAYALVKMKLERKASTILLSEIQGDA